MGRPKLLCLLSVSVAITAAVPAAAQFGAFGDTPRPPASVRGGAPQPYPQYPTYPPSQPTDYQNQNWAPPQRPIQSQPLPALPGTEPTQESDAPRQAQPPLFGLSPGQRQPHGAPPQPANTAPQPGDEVVTTLPSEKIPNPNAVFSGLDKITGRITTFDVAINETVQFGALRVTPRVCYTRPPTETANTDGFVEVEEITLQGEIKRIFTGWMFAASPGLHGVEHAIYDVWLIDCKKDASAVTAGPTLPNGPAIMSPPAQAATPSSTQKR